MFLPFVSGEERERERPAAPLPHPHTGRILHSSERGGCLAVGKGSPLSLLPFTPLLTPIPSLIPLFREFDCIATNAAQRPHVGRQDTFKETQLSQEQWDRLT